MDTRFTEERLTTDIIVRSIKDANHGSDVMTKTSSTDKRSRSGGIVRSIAGVHQLFEDVIRISIPAQKIDSDVADLAPKIRIQQVAFHNSCKMLLVTAAKSRQDVDNMIEDPGHPIWKDKAAHQNLDKVMVRFCHLCLEVLEHFQESLGELKAGLHALQRKKTAMSRYKYWLHMSNPPTFGTIEDMPRLIQNLTNYNDIFCTLVWQAVPRRSYFKVGLSAKKYSHPYAIEAVQASHHHYGCIQQASQVLYDTLSRVWICGDHDSHSLNISLDFDYAKAGTLFRDEYFRFIVAVTSPCFDGQYRLVVEIAHREFCSNQTSEEDQSASKNMYGGNSVPGPGARISASNLPKFGDDTAAHRVECQRTETFTRAASLRQGVPDSGLEVDLCSWLRNSSFTSEPSQQAGDFCLQSLGTENDIRFLFSCVLRDECQKQGSHSLDDVLMRANNERRAIPLEDRLRTASLLGASVLHLNTSSWLRQAWSSKDIQYFELDDYERCALGEPFLQTQLDSSSACGPVYDVESSDATRSCLFSLGLVLIELAFSAPLRRLQLQEDIGKGLLEWERNLLNLIRLNNTVSRELGSRYAKVVETCLFQGLEAKETHGLGKAELNEVIFEDIVKELDRCLSAVTLKSESGV